jgi:cytoskeletal protein RodZ
MLKIQKHFVLSKKVALIALAVILVGGGVAYITVKRHEAQQTPNSPINLKPATKQDKQRAEDNKSRIVKEETSQNSQPQTTNTKKSVTPTITYAGQYGDSVEVGGYVSGIFEDGGTCTATFTQNGASITKTSSGVENANSVSCPAITAKAEEFSPRGTWKVTLSYSSATASGVSESRNIEVK